MALIPSGVSKDSATLRARDVEFELKGVDVDPKVRAILYKLAEINHVNTKAVAELATMFNQMVDVMTGFQVVAGNMKETIQKMGQVQADVPDDIDTLN